MLHLLASNTIHITYLFSVDEMEHKGGRVSTSTTERGLIDATPHGEQHLSRHPNQASCLPAAGGAKAVHLVLLDLIHPVEDIILHPERGTPCSAQMDKTFDDACQPECIIKREKVQSEALTGRTTAVCRTPHRPGPPYRNARTSHRRPPWTYTAPSPDKLTRRSKPWRKHEVLYFMKRWGTRRWRGARGQRR
jgi:hypothetical protein